MHTKITKDENDIAMRLTYDIAKDDFGRAGEASSKIKKFLRQLGIESSIIRRVSIATYEAEINVVIHSLGGAIDVLLKPETIEIFVEDNGPGIEDVQLAMTKGFSTATHKIREMGFGAGMGLPNIKKCCDEFYIESKVGSHTILKLIFNL